MLNKIQEKLSKIIKYAVAIICFIIGVLALFLTVYFKVKMNDAIEACYTKIDNIFFNLINVCIGLGALYGFYKASNKINKKLLFILVLVISMIFGFAWVNYILNLN